MATERTLSIIKPDATRCNLTGEINARFERAGLRIVAQRRLRLTREQAEALRLAAPRRDLAIISSLDAVGSNDRIRERPF